jgi:KUP system potassium uptake protein
VLGFQSSGNLAAAYGIAVSGTLAIDAVLAGIVALSLWRWPGALVIVVFGAFLAIDLTFLSANALKILAGGWFPILFAVVAFVLMSTWRRGREVMFERLYRGAPSLRAFLASLSAHPPTYGFMERPDVTVALRSCQLGPPEPTLMDTSFFLSRETYLPSARRDLPRWRERIFIHMANAALDATRFFRLPPDRVVELGSQVEI